MEKLNLIYYSPTNGTEKIVKKIAENLEIKEISELNITKKEIEVEIQKDSLNIIALPVYSGRLPLAAVERLKKLKANNAPTVIIVVYGNRHYDDAILELKDITKELGFKIIAGGAFIAEHSFSTIEKPIAEGRPDKSDLEKCEEFSKLILNQLNNLDKIIEINIPGKFPYKEASKLPNEIHPETDSKKCNNCGICIDVCPTNAINEEIFTNGELCTCCSACIKKCPSGARIFDNSSINALREKLYTNFSERREVEFFIN